MASDVRSRGPAAEGTSEADLDLGAIGRALWGKKLWVLLPAALVALLAFAAVTVVTPRYKSEARIIIEGRENVFLRPEAEKGAERDRSVIDQEAVASQVQLALSREVARHVIKELKLNERPEFDPVLRGIGTLRQALIMLGVARDPLRMTPEERVFDSYYERIQAYQIDKSRVIAVEFRSSDPELAARAANAVADGYLALLQEVKQDQTRSAGQFLSAQIADLQAKVAEAESKAEQFRAKSNLFVGTNNNTLSNQTLGEINSQLATARSQAADAQSKARLIRDMLRSGRPIESGDIINSELIRRLNEQLVTLRAQLAEQSSTLLGAHPRIKELRAQIADLERQIRGEAERLVRALENDARIAGARVEELGARLEQLKRQAATTNEQDVQLRALEREARAARELLESYMAKYRETIAREKLGVAPADARVISRAIVSNTPYFPKKLPIVLIATLATLSLGIGFVTAGELLAGAAYRASGLVMPSSPHTSLGAHAAFGPPAAAQGAEAAAAGADECSLSAVAAKLRARPEGRSRTTVAALDAETSAATTLALALALCAHGRTVAIDLSLGSPPSALAERNPGIADLVRGAARFGEVIARDWGSQVHRIAAGRAEADGGEILRSERLAIALEALQRTYEHVVINAGALDAVAPEQLVRLSPHVVLAGPPAAQEQLAGIEPSLRDAGCEEFSIIIAEPPAAAPAAAA